MSALIRIADAVVESLNAGRFSQQVVAERSYLPAADLDALATLHVTVVPDSEQRRPVARGIREQECTVTIGIQKRINPDERAEHDALEDLAEELANHLEGRHLDAAEAKFASIAREPVFSPEHLQQYRVFTSVISVTYRVHR